MWNTVFLSICMNVILVSIIFFWVWYTASKNKNDFSEKIIDLKKIVSGIDNEMSISVNTVNDFNENLLLNLKDFQLSLVDVKDHTKEIRQETHEIKEISKKNIEQHEEYHNNMLEKLNHAGELIVNYESFYESTLSELDEVIRFLEILSKRPTLSTDPDFANFSRAVQLVSQIISRYSSVAENLKRGELKDKNT